MGWSFLMNLARTANYTYGIEFSEDFQRAELKIKGNIAIFCCCCCPCIPAWYTFPQWMCNQYMVQADGSVEGDHWIRYRGICCQDAEYYYDLKTVYTPDGEPTRF